MVARSTRPLGSLALWAMLLASSAPARADDVPAPATGVENSATDRFGDRLPAGAVGRLGTTRLRHGGAVQAIAFAPDGKVLATAGQDARIRLWAVATGRELRALEGHPGGVGALAFAPNGRAVASAGLGQTVYLWETATGRQRLQLDGPWQRVTGLAFRPDGRALAAWGVSAGPRADYSVRLWNSVTGQELCALTGHTGAVYQAAFSPDGTLLASCSADGTTRLWNGRTGRQFRVLQPHGARSLAFTADGRTLATADGTPMVRLWGAVTGRPIASLPDHSAGTLALAVPAQGGLLVTGGRDGGVHRWDIAAAKVVASLPGDGTALAALAVSPDGRTVASAGRGDHAVRLRDLGGARAVARPAGHAAPVNAVAFSAHGRTVATAAGDGTVRLWDTATNRPTLRIVVDRYDRAALAVGLLGLGGPAGPGAFAAAGAVADQPMPRAVKALAFSPAAAVLASAGSDGAVRLWDTGTGRPLGSLRGHAGPIRAVAFSRDGKRLASAGDDGSVRLWDVGTRREVCRMRAHGHPVLAMAFAADGRKVAAACADATVRVFDVATARQLAELRGHAGQVTAVAFAPDGRALASGGGAPRRPDSMIVLWDLATGRELRRLFGRRNLITALAFSPDGTVLASANGSAAVPGNGAAGRAVAGEGDFAIHLWEVASGRQLRRLSGHRGWVTAVAFAPDGKTLASGSRDTTALLWRVDRGRLGLGLGGAADNPVPLPLSPPAPAVAEASLPAGALFGMRQPGGLTTAALSPDEKVFAVADPAGAVVLRDAATGREVGSLTGQSGPVGALVFSPDGKQLASGGAEAAGHFAIRVWAVSTGRLLLTLDGHRHPVCSLSYSGDGKMLASGDRGEGIRWWKASTGKELGMLTSAAGRAGPQIVCFAPKGALLAWGNGATGRIRLLTPGTDRDLPALAGHESDVTALAFSADAALLASAGGQGEVCIWEAATSRKQLGLPADPHGHPVGVLAFSPDGRLLALGGPRGNVSLRETATGKEVRRLPGHDLDLRTLSFSADGRRLLSASADGMVLIWDLRSPGFWGVPVPALKPRPDELPGLWADLVGGDAGAAACAAYALTLAPELTTPFLKDRLRPADADDKARLQRLVADLDHDRYAVREAATAELKRLRAGAVPLLLRQALQGRPSAELRRRAEAILRAIAPAGDAPQPGELTGEPLRTVRAIAILERLGTPQARDILRALARGEPGAVETRQARASLGRLQGPALP